MLSINWRRGLFRLWIAASFVWLIIAGAFVQEGIRRDVSTLMTDRSAELRPVTDFIGSGSVIAYAYAMRRVSR